MATEKKFGTAGVSTLNGKTKIRWANDAMRIKILIKNGHENVELINLPREMTKREIALYLQEIEFKKDDVDVQAAIRYVLRKNPADSVDSEPEALVAV
jgi:hypothetical protein